MFSLEKVTAYKSEIANSDKIWVLEVWIDSLVNLKTWNQWILCPNLRHTPFIIQRWSSTESKNIPIFGDTFWCHHAHIQLKITQWTFRVLHVPSIFPDLMQIWINSNFLFMESLEKPSFVYHFLGLFLNADSKKVHKIFKIGENTW